MVADPSILTGLSTASTVGGNTPINGPTLTLADTSFTSSDPTQAINSSVKSGIRILKYPLEMSPYYLQINLARYRRNSWISVGDLETRGSIIFPLPATIASGQSVLFEDVPLGAVVGGTLNSVGNLVGGFNNPAGAAATSLLPAAGTAIGGAINRFSGGVVGGAVKAATAPALVAAGAAVNQFLTVMLKGPVFRELEFAWRFSPNNRQESEALENIIAALNDAASPVLPPTNASVFFGFPMVFTLSFNHADLPSSTDTPGQGSLGLTVKGQKYAKLFAFQPAVLASRIFNYTPSGQAAHYGQTKSPESVEIHLKFKELNYWLAGMYGTEFTGTDIPSIIPGTPSGGTLTPGADGTAGGQVAP